MNEQPDKTVDPVTPFLTEESQKSIANSVYAPVPMEQAKARFKVGTRFGYLKEGVLGTNVYVIKAINWETRIALVTCPMNPTAVKKYNHITVDHPNNHDDDRLRIVADGAEVVVAETNHEQPPAAANFSAEEPTSEAVIEPMEEVSFENTVVETSNQEVVSSFIEPPLPKQKVTISEPVSTKTPLRNLFAYLKDLYNTAQPVYQFSQEPNNPKQLNAQYWHFDDWVDLFQTATYRSQFGFSTTIFSARRGFCPHRPNARSRLYHPARTHRLGEHCAAVWQPHARVEPH